MYQVSVTFLGMLHGIKISVTGNRKAVYTYLHFIPQPFVKEWMACIQCVT
jgi:hypothetical protein